MSVPLDDTLLETVIDDLRFAWAANYGTAAFTILVYDIILTSGREITYIWRAKWSFPKFIYLFIRYYGLANLGFTISVLTNTSNSIQVVCRRYFYLLTFGGPLVFSTLSNIILMLRIHALYNRSQRVLVILVLLFAGQFTAELYCSIRVSGSFVMSTVPGIPWPGCIMTTFYSPGVLIGWIPDLITATLLFFLTMWNLIHSILSTRGWRGIFGQKLPHAARRIPPLFSIFFKDGTVHYFTMMVAMVVLVSITFAAPAPLGTLTVPWLITWYSFATSRLILNLRVAAAHLQGSTTTWDQTFSIRMPDLATYSDESTESDEQVEGIEENLIGLRSFG